MRTGGDTGPYHEVKKSAGDPDARTARGVPRSGRFLHVSSFTFLLFPNSLLFGGLRCVDDFGGQVSRNLLVAGEVHFERALSAGDRT